MSSHSFLIARPDKRPVFASPDGANEIAYASDWIPIGWLAMFEPRDVQLVEEPPESHSYDPETITRCPTLMRKKEAAIDLLQKRKSKLSKVLPQHLQDQLGGLEKAVRASPLPYVQLVVSDLDMFASPGSERSLRQLISTLDTDDVKQWRSLLASVDTEMGKDFSKVQFPELNGSAAVVGYLPEQFTVSTKAETTAPAKKSDAKAKPAAKAKQPAAKTKATQPAATAKAKPWWKFW
jgi:hypothetical protein